MSPEASLFLGGPARERLPACLRGWPLEAGGMASGRLPGPAPGSELPPLRSIRTTVSPTPLTWKGSEEGAHALSRRRRMGGQQSLPDSCLSQK